MHTQSGQEAGCSFLRAQHLDETFLKFFSHLSNLKNTITFPLAIKLPLPKNVLVPQVPMCPSHGCRVTCHAHVLPASQALQPPLGARTLQRRSTVTVCSHSLSWRVQVCILHSFGNCMPSDGDLHTDRMLHSCCVP